ncbi:prepilin-type N-terminal cleavage/methylation domain-containing protein [Oscillibacter sp.]|uniref:prepilin-type N-terminal cleavage/methylation domain-containing protein n=1 Tax=Oscillibacter sp. TaxID=1945593 RepID=UPI00262B896F|nr:prepilin-type N-terminal cleavage/methylation domain-containing protein [Oscillibacter sp.]MDD3347992.1 prepilin-type N-terminal cleavage/methylation domain-containing protein [Oscillibacter sp.]
MKNKNQKKNTGFTLVELIIVIAILGVLSAVVTPQYVRYVEKTRSTKCTAQRNEVIRAFAMECMASEDFFSRASGADSAALSGMVSGEDGLGTALTCPSRGTLTYRFNTDADTLEITCSEHAEATIAAEITMQKFAGNFVQAYYDLIAQGKSAKAALDALRQDPRYSGYSLNYLSNEEVRKLTYNASGGWVPVNIDGKTYYSKVMANASKPDFKGAEDVIVYANKNDSIDAKNDWSANYVYYNGYWYQPPAGADSMASKTMSQLKAAIDAADSKWKRVDG